MIENEPTSKVQSTWYSLDTVLLIVPQLLSLNYLRDRRLSFFGLL